MAEVLFRAADRVQFGGWTQHTYARDMFGNDVSPESPEATSWCMFGAILTVVEADSESEGELVEFLEKRLGCPIGPWNDDPTRTSGEVADTMRRCAKELLEAS